MPAAGADVVRTSAGVYSARTPSVLFPRVATDNGLTTTVVDSRFDPSILPLLPFPNALTTLPPNAAISFPQPVLGFDPDFRNPRTFQAAAAIDHEIGGPLQLSAGYAHARTWFLQRRLDRNLFPPTTTRFGLPIFQRRARIPRIGSLSFNESTAKADYNAVVSACRPDRAVSGAGALHRSPGTRTTTRTNAPPTTSRRSTCSTPSRLVVVEAGCAAHL